MAKIDEKLFAFQQCNLILSTKTARCKKGVSVFTTHFKSSLVLSEDILEFTSNFFVKKISPIPVRKLRVTFLRALREKNPAVLQKGEDSDQRKERKEKVVIKESAKEQNYRVRRAGMIKSALT